MDRLIQYARDEGDTFRSRDDTILRRSGQLQAVPPKTVRSTPWTTPRSLPPSTRAVAFIEPDIHSATASPSSSGNVEGLLAIEADRRSSIQTSELLYTVEGSHISDQEKLLFLQRQHDDARWKLPHHFRDPNPRAQQPSPRLHTVIPPNIAGDQNATPNRV